MHDPVEHAPVLLPRRVRAEHALAEHAAVQRARGREHQARRAGAEVRDDRGVACRAGLDDLSREQVGVDYGQVVRRRG